MEHSACLDLSAIIYSIIYIYKNNKVKITERYLVVVTQHWCAVQVDNCLQKLLIRELLSHY